MGIPVPLQNHLYNRSTKLMWQKMLNLPEPAQVSEEITRKVPTTTILQNRWIIIPAQWGLRIYRTFCTIRAHVISLVQSQCVCVCVKDIGSISTRLWKTLRRHPLVLVFFCVKYQKHTTRIICRKLPAVSIHFTFTLTGTPLPV